MPLSSRFGAAAFACLCSVALLPLACGNDDEVSSAGGASGTGGAPAGAGGSSASDAGIDAAADGADPDRDSGPARSYYLASSGVQLLVTGPELGLQMSVANLATDVDLIAVHQEFYGLPWQAFESGTALPVEWTAKMQALATAARDANKGVFLSVNMLNGARDSLAERTVIESGKVESEGWAARCYDFASAPDGAAKRAAYLRYVSFMLDLFEPRYVNFAIEVNLFFEKCPSAVPGLIEVANAAYDLIEAEAPDVVAFPSFQIDHLYGYSEDSCPPGSQREACFDALYAQIVPMKRDRFAISSYPYLNALGGAAQLPSDWFTRGAARGGERPVIAETGWLSTPMVAEHATLGCYTVTSQTESDARTYLDRVLVAAETADMDLVTWWANRDLVISGLMANCPCTIDTTWCTVVDIFRGPASAGPDAQFFGELALKAFGTMGIRDYTGAPKGSVFERWQQALERRLAVR